MPTCAFEACGKEIDVEFEGKPDSFFLECAHCGSINCFKRQPALRKSESTPDVVYRYFSNESHANDLISGKLFVSTLETCRKYEDPLQGDSEEGVERYSSGPPIDGDSDDPEFCSFAENMGISLGGVRGFSITNFNKVTRLEDGFVLCTTLGFSTSDLTDTFGKYCVEIYSVDDFFVEVCEALSKEWGVKKGIMGPVIYKDRQYVGFDSPPGPIGLVKPPDKYESQNEFRFLWFKDSNEDIKPGVIEIPGIRKFVRRIK